VTADQESARDARPSAPVGLCANCAHARVVMSGKGSTFLLCGKSAVDPSFAKYPRLPVLRCAGFVAVAARPQGNQR
jgi:hypothetical protein